ncbi:MAG: ATP-binding cassette domain-containing protein [Myxococcales bacterium]|nr:ATP-binding cassette domain-containing protein [Myxococcales bacterium]
MTDLSVHFPIYGGVLRHKVATVKAVDGISMEILPGETVGLVGESGSGKTTVGRAISNLHKAMSPEVELGGHIWFDAPDGRVDVNGLARKAMLPLRSEIQMIFQDPFSSLNPRMTVQQIVEGPLLVHKPEMQKAERLEFVADLLDRVGLQPKYAERYPHEFSGGQRQRIGIARSLATHPKLIIADEPVSALDVSVQAQVINLMQELQEEFGLTYLFVAHDLSIVYHISDRIAVMYLGSLVEYGSAEDIYLRPKHPYSKALISAVPRADASGKRAKRTVLQGDIPTPLAKPSGCGFRTRCPIAKPDCAEDVPKMRDMGAGHLVACPYAD